MSKLLKLSLYAAMFVLLGACDEDNNNDDDDSYIQNVGSSSSAFNIVQ